LLQELHYQFIHKYVVDFCIICIHKTYIFAKYHCLGQLQVHSQVAWSLGKHYYELPHQPQRGSDEHKSHPIKKIKTFIGLAEIIFLITHFT